MVQDYQTAYGFGGSGELGRQDWLAGRLHSNTALTADTLSKAYSSVPQFGRQATAQLQQCKSSCKWPWLSCWASHNPVTVRSFCDPWQSCSLCLCRLADDVMLQQQQQQHPALARAALEQQQQQQLQQQTSSFQAFGGDPAAVAAAWGSRQRSYDGARACFSFCQVACLSRTMDTYNLQAW